VDRAADPEIHLAATLAQELGPRNIRVNALSPGSVLFPGGGWEEFSLAEPDKFAVFAAGDFPRGRLAELNEVAGVACFLLSERGSGISGANICVDAAQDHPSAGRLFERGQGEGARAGPFAPCAAPLAGPPARGRDPRVRERLRR
jgi:Enoyl-(Acyl carrier protein) reductase